MSKNNDVELPDPVDTSELPDSVKKGMSSKVIVLTLLVAAAVFVIITMLLQQGKAELVASVPELEKAWVVARVEGEEIAANIDRTVLDGRGVMLYLVAYGYDKTKDAYFYYTDSPSDELPRIAIDGKEIPQDKLRRFEFLNTHSIVYWFKFEVSPLYLRQSNLALNQRIHWTNSRKHKMNNRWWTISDVRADISAYHHDYVGTMYFYADLEVFGAEDSNNLLANLKSEGSIPEQVGEIPEGMLRITQVPAFREGLDKYYRAYLNLPAYQEWENTDEANELTEKFQGGSSRSYLIGALKLMGYELDFDDPDFLEKVADPLYENVFIDEFGFFRAESKPKSVIPYGENGVKPDDIIVLDDRYMILVKNELEKLEPQTGALSANDRVLDAYNFYVRETFMHVLKLSEEKISIWRLKNN